MVCGVWAFSAIYRGGIVCTCAVSALGELAVPSDLPTRGAICDVVGIAFTIETGVGIAALGLIGITAGRAIGFARFGEAGATCVAFGSVAAIV